MRRKRKHLKKGPICQNTVTFARQTMFGPNRPAADMEGIGEFHFCLIYEDFRRIYEDFWIFFIIFGEFLRIFENFLKRFGNFEVR